MGVLDPVSVLDPALRPPSALVEIFRYFRPLRQPLLGFPQKGARGSPFFFNWYPCDIGAYIYFWNPDASICGLILLPFVHQKWPILGGWGSPRNIFFLFVSLYPIQFFRTLQHALLWFYQKAHKRKRKKRERKKMPSIMATSLRWAN